MDAGVRESTNGNFRGRIRKLHLQIMQGKERKLAGTEGLTSPILLAKLK